ncbi:MAG: YceI family protein [Desulfobacterales bacterium]
MKKIILIALSLVLMGQTQVMGYQWKIDPNHSSVTFAIKHIYATIHGRFSDFTGDVIFNPDDLQKAKFDFVIHVNSIDTHYNSRDTYLRSSAFLDANKYPVMTFKSSSVSHVSGDKYLVKGKFTIKDVTKELTLPFIYLGQKVDPLNKNEMVGGFDCRFKINRFDYHVGNGRLYKMGVVGKEVDIFISMEVLRNK